MHLILQKREREKNRMAGLLPAPSFYPRNKQLPTSLLGPATHAPGPQDTMPDSLLGRPDVRYVNGRNIENLVNATITEKVRVVADGSSGTLNDIDNSLDPGSLHFSRIPDATSSKYVGPQGRVLVHDAPRNVKSAEALNFYLKSEKGRLEYGKETDAKRLHAEWGIEGGLLTYDEPQNAGNRAERTVTMGIGKRVRMPDLFAAGGPVAPRNGCHLYGVYMRHPLDTPSAAAPDDGKSSPRVFGERKVPKNPHVPDTYWQLHLIRMPAGDPEPSTMLYTNSEWTGKCFYIGKQTGFFPKPQHAQFQQIYAQRALHPDMEDAQCRRKDTICLHEIEVMLLVK